MPTEIVASEEQRVEYSQDMNPTKPGGAVLPGFARAHLTIYGPDDECSETLPTIRELLAECLDASSGLIHLGRFVGVDVQIESASLSGFPDSYRVGPGYSFVTRSALARIADNRAP